MDMVSKETLKFFEKYSMDGSNLEFAKDFGTLTATLRARVRREETLIYQEYEKLQ